MSKLITETKRKWRIGIWKWAQGKVVHDVTEGMPYGVKNSGFAEASGKGGGVFDMLNVDVHTDGSACFRESRFIRMEFITIR